MERPTTELSGRVQFAGCGVSFSPASGNPLVQELPGVLSRGVIAENLVLGGNCRSAEERPARNCCTPLGLRELQGGFYGAWGLFMFSDTSGA